MHDRPTAVPTSPEHDALRLIRCTAATPGAIAILQIVGGDASAVLSELTGRSNNRAVDDWPIGRLRHVRFGDIDDGLAGRINERISQVMPHGGPRVVQRLTARLVELGVSPVEPRQADPRDLYPEAEDPFEALMLAALARAASPLAIDLLLDQPQRWRALTRTGDRFTEEDHERSRRLNRLITPPRIVLAGPANVGKSTLSNALLGRAMSIALDLPGTTRDYTVGRVNLAGLVVDWYDTPGLRDAADDIEQRAIELAADLMRSADMLIAMTDACHDWPALPRPPDLRVASKADLSRRRPEPDDRKMLAVSAMSGEGLPALVERIVESLVPRPDRASPRPWRFDDRLPIGGAGRPI